MREDEYTALRSRAGFYDTPESQRYRWRTGYALQAISVGFTLWLAPIIVINEVLPPRDLVVPLGFGSLREKPSQGRPQRSSLDSPPVTRVVTFVERIPTCMETARRWPVRRPGRHLCRWPFWIR